MSRLAQILDALESFHGPQQATWPTDPYQFLIWWHCGYPASDERCRLGWQSLTADIGFAPTDLLAVPSARLARALTPGGMVPALRAAKVKTIAQLIVDRCGGNLRAELSRPPLPKAYALLKTFPGIGRPGADRILLFSGIAAVAAVPSNCPYVLARIASDAPPANYDACYRLGQQTLAGEIEEAVDARRRAYLLLKRHGLRDCKRTSPRCATCPVAGSCAYFSGRLRPKTRGADAD